MDFHMAREAPEEDGGTQLPGSAAGIHVRVNGLAIFAGGFTLTLSIM
jgi:hypothetical protein